MHGCDGHGERVGRIGARDRRAGQQHLEHRLDLRLLRRPGADDGLLDQPRGVFGYRQPGAPARRQHRAARLRQLEGRLRVLVDEHLLDRRAVGRVGGNHRGDGVVEMREPLGHGRVRLGRHLPVGQVCQPRSFCADKTPAGAGKRGIEAENDQPSFSITSSETS